MEAITKYATESAVKWAIVHETYDAFEGRVSVFGTTREYLNGVATLSQVETDLLAAVSCHMEVCNGGFYQFFHNRTGVVAPEAKIAFAHLGLTEVAEVVSAAMNFFGVDYPREQVARLERLAKIPEGPRKEVDSFHTQDVEFYRLLDWEKKIFERALWRYYMNSL